ncbi:hypothetical protein ALP29_00516 [Pseudomonas syringae pv. avii]|uniref:Uncharacterized protein n=2 Tax=Pseudomonas syringae TaxID=317 RepID=A0A3M5UVN2_PSESX|nr:hypothetical protein ALP43_01424 [Pseudomonas azotoformans]RMU49856.1 hypothetical protein ALP29_00516 [Pseudomonas syringae pv. avii]
MRLSVGEYLAGEFDECRTVNRPPEYPDYPKPGEPRWGRWGLALGSVVGMQSVLLLMLWPKEQPRLEMLLWSALLPLGWGVMLAVRVLVWQILLFNRQVYLRTSLVATNVWWQRRRLGLPVQSVVLLGPAGDVQANYLHLMKDAAPPKVFEVAGAIRPRLRCQVSLSVISERAPALGRHLGRLALASAELSECWPHLRAVVWVGSKASQTAFEDVLTKGGIVLPSARLPLQNLAELDHLIDVFHRDCSGENDWLLCAGVSSIATAQDGELPGEAGFYWRVSRQARQLLHRGEYLADGASVELCAQMQRYAGLEQPPSDCLALDKASQDAFVEGGWSAAEHQLAGQWGVLGDLAPFIGMSLALLQAGAAGQPCGWLSQDANKRLAIGVAVPYGNS